MNAKPGGKQPIMRDTINPFTGNIQRLVFSIGVPKGLIQVLKERGIDTRNMKVDMRKELASHSGFRDEKTKIKHTLNRRGHACILLPKFHCELKDVGLRRNVTLEHTRIIQLLDLDGTFQMVWIQ